MINKTTFKNLILVENKAYKDSRGYFKELIREKVLKKKFPFTVMSFSKKNVIRGLHLQEKKSQGKFISVLKGKIFDVAVDLRKTLELLENVLNQFLVKRIINLFLYHPVLHMAFVL